MVNVDHLGCATHVPAATAAVSTAAMVSVEPVAVRVCQYGRYGLAGRLVASGELGQGDARWLAEAINAAKPGRNPDVPAWQCTEASPPQPDVVLHFVGADGTVSWLWATFSSCTGRGIDNGAHQVWVDRPMIERFMTPLRTGISWSGSLELGAHPDKPTKPAE